MNVWSIKIRYASASYFRYEKPYIARNRVNLERSKSIYDEDMRNKINFIMRKNRTDPYPGTN